MADVEWTRDGEVLVVTLNRPERRNAVGGSMLRLLREAFTVAADDDEVRVVVTTGAGTDFCVGADIGALAEAASADGPTDGSRDGVRPDRGGRDNGLRPLGPAEVILDRLGPGRWVREMAGFPKPTVAAIRGAAAGGGLCLAALHDFRVAAPDARFAAGFVAVGLAPEMGLTRLLPRLVGAQRARRMLVLNERVDAARALEIGLVDEISPDADVLAAALGLARRIAAFPPLAVRATLDLLADRGDGWEAALEAEYAVQRILFASADHREAVAAFGERRPPAFRGR